MNWIDWIEGDTRGARFARYLAFALGMMLLTLAASLVQRWTGREVTVPPPPVQVVVQPAPGTEHPPSVTVFQAKP